MMNVVLKTRNVAFKTRNFVSKTRDFVFKMMNFAVALSATLRMPADVYSFGQ